MTRNEQKAFRNASVAAALALKISDIPPNLSELVFYSGPSVDCDTHLDLLRTANGEGPAADAIRWAVREIDRLKEIEFVYEELKK